MLATMDYADTIHDKCRRNSRLVSTEGSTVLVLPSLAIDTQPGRINFQACAFTA